MWKFITGASVTVKESQDFKSLIRVFTLLCSPVIHLKAPPSLLLVFFTLSQCGACPQQGRRDNWYKLYGNGCEKKRKDGEALRRDSGTKGHKPLIVEFVEETMRAKQMLASNNVT
ncbi:hypothetical protein LWI29_015453 [Acer saccharum]|uniref:Uncharacterized protein n=1 Tax=Acer saccharum TaxID=4024 RepID=A0AA39TEK9_ACESA|nr:hypothetical protein LWI29_015453 [Acer saccharum]